MTIFLTIYQKMLTWAQSRYASYWLCMVSFAESFILPYPPPDVILAPMALKQPDKGYYYAMITTITSVLGGVVGYLIGAYAFDLLLPFLQKTNYLPTVEKVKIWFDVYGIWIIAIAGFSPVPYKIFTLGAGLMSMAFLPFVLMSLLARGTRYYLVVFFVKKFGTSCDTWLQKYIDRLGYALIVIIVLGVWYAY